jgi:hypothetical protein
MESLAAAPVLLPLAKRHCCLRVWRDIPRQRRRPRSPMAAHDVRRRRTVMSPTLVVLSHTRNMARPRQVHLSKQRRRTAAGI